jgi:Tol biopolymer transport system component
MQQSNESALAWERYYRASQIKGPDTASARTLAANLALVLTPTPTPTATPTMTPVPTPTGTTRPTATPTYVPIATLKGKIAYRSNRSGTYDVWIMDPDGQNPTMIWQQQPAIQDFAKLQQAEVFSPDGRARVYVEKPRGSDTPQIWVRESDKEPFKVTDWGGGLNYDPVWSPKGYWIAFVSSTVGNDEIFLIGTDGDHAKRLTKNDWEWDKHPSWSPDGGRLVFWSNRETGHGQIWLMNDDGSGQVNLSKNEFDEKDPIWIK